MPTKRELEVEVKDLQRELGSQVGAGAAAVASAQAKMNASIAVGDESRRETMVGNQAKSAEQQSALLNSGQDLVVSHSPVTQVSPPTGEVAEVGEPEAEAAEEGEPVSETGEAE